MTLIIQKPTGAKLVLRKELPADAEADAYIAAVEAADGQALEPGVKFAIKNFVLGCKADGIWTAIKASCILAGARTLTGALVPLVGTAPTSFNFVDGDYTRKTGLKGNESNKRLDSNRAANADSASNYHLSFFASEVATVNLYPNFISGQRNLFYDRTVGSPFYGFNDFAGSVNSGPATTGFVGGTKNGTARTIRANSALSSNTGSAGSPNSETSKVFCASNVNDPSFYSNARLAFYSIGESLNLALLDSRVTDLINAFGVAIP
jgi:hypothetical protein